MVALQRNEEEEERYRYALSSDDSLSRRSVSFGHLEFWYFPPIIGDNPSVSSGVPIALGFQPQCNSVVEIELYEQRRKPRRSTRDLKITREDREAMLLGVGYGMEEINAASKISRKSRNKLHPSNGHGFQATLEGTTRKLKGMVHLNSHSRSGYSRSLAKSRVDEQDDESRSRVRQYTDAPPKPGQRRGSLTLGSSDHSARPRSMRRWSSDLNLKTGSNQSFQQNHDPPRPTHRRDSFGDPSSPQKAPMQEGLITEQGDFWSRLKDSSPASPQPAQRRGSVQDLVELYQQSESSENSELHMIHYYQYGETSEPTPRISQRRSSHTGATSTDSSSSTRRWSIQGSKSLDASPRPGARRSSIKKDDVVKATLARRRSSFFGGSAVNRDSQPAPTQRRTSLKDSNPAPSSRGAPARRLSFLNSFHDFQWSPTKSDKDETESTVSVASSALSELRRQHEPSSLLGPIPDLSSDSKARVTQRRRSFLGGLRESAPESDVIAVTESSPRRRSTILGGILDPTVPLLSAPSKCQDESSKVDGTRHNSNNAGRELARSSTHSNGSGHESQPVAQVKRRSSFLGSILVRDGPKSIAAV